MEEQIISESEKEYQRIAEEWARKVPKEFMQYGILAAGVSA